MGLSRLKRHTGHSGFPDRLVKVQRVPNLELFGMGEGQGCPSGMGFFFFNLALSLKDHP